MPGRTGRTVLALVMLAAVVLVGSAAGANAGTNASGGDAFQLRKGISGDPASGRDLAVDGGSSPAAEAATAGSSTPTDWSGPPQLRGASEHSAPLERHAF